MKNKYPDVVTQIFWLSLACYWIPKFRDGVENYCDYRRWLKQEKLKIQEQRYVSFREQTGNPVWPELILEQKLRTFDLVTTFREY
jgi:hypothetical protein